MKSTCRNRAIPLVPACRWMGALRTHKESRGPKTWMKLRPRNKKRDQEVFAMRQQNFQLLLQAQLLVGKGRNGNFWGRERERERESRMSAKDQTGSYKCVLSIGAWCSGVFRATDATRVRPGQVQSIAFLSDTAHTSSYTHLLFAQ